MRSTITAIQMAIRTAFVVQLALGLAFWTGNLLGLVDLHQLLGILLVLALWTQAVLAYRAGVPAGMAHSTRITTRGGTVSLSTGGSAPPAGPAVSRAPAAQSMRRMGDILRKVSILSRPRATSNWRPVRRH